MPETPSPYAVSQSGMSPPLPSIPSQAPPTVLPKVFGIIHICYALLGGLIAFVGVAGMLFMKILAEKGGDEFKEMKPILDVYDGMATFMYVDVALKLILAAMLLLAGVGLLKRKAWSIKLTVVWAISRMLVAVGMLAWGLKMAAVIQEKLPPVQGAQQEQFQQMSQSVGNVMGIVFIMIYPVVSLIFLTKKSVRDAMQG